jgi:hypothetical protein
LVFCFGFVRWEKPNVLDRVVAFPMFFKCSSDFSLACCQRLGYGFVAENV